MAEGVEDANLIKEALARAKKTTKVSKRGRKARKRHAKKTTKVSKRGRNARKRHLEVVNFGALN